MSDITINGDGNIVGDHNQVINNIRSKLTHVSQEIGTTDGLHNDDRAELEKLINELSNSLKDVPKEKQDDAELVADLTAELVGNLKQSQPKAKLLEIKGENLIKAANNLAAVTPTVLLIATKIVEVIGQIVHR